MFGSTASLESFSGIQRREMFRSQPDGSSEDSETAGQNSAQMKKRTTCRDVGTSCDKNVQGETSLQEKQPSLEQNKENEILTLSKDETKVPENFEVMKGSSQRKSSSPTFKNILRRSSLAAQFPSKTNPDSTKSKQIKSPSSNFLDRFRRSSSGEKTEVKLVHSSMDNGRSPTIMKKSSHPQPSTLKQHLRRFSCAEKNSPESQPPRNENESQKKKPGLFSMGHSTGH